uniref:Uncharacterized protein n=1 Tax=virus sp. ctmTa7 TaxID=2828255 RepID=A0A8S5RC10_9VIRU|nr:MAG TPA: hypothetical protein [virus sp. ctmTa7]
MKNFESVCKLTSYSIWIKSKHTFWFLLPPIHKRTYVLLKLVKIIVFPNSNSIQYNLLYIV